MTALQISNATQVRMVFLESLFCPTLEGTLLFLFTIHRLKCSSKFVSEVDKFLTAAHWTQSAVDVIRNVKYCLKLCFS